MTQLLQQHLVIAPLLVPLLGGILLLLMRGSATPLRRLVSMLSVQLLFGVALLLLLTVSDGRTLVYALGGWPAPFGIVLVADRLAAMLVLLTALLALFAMMHAIQGSDRSGRQFHVLFQFQLLGLNGAFLTGDLFNLFVFFEVLLIASYGLLLHGGGPDRSRAGLHYVVVNLVGSSLFLFAVGTLYGVLGTLNMADMAVRVAALPPADRALVQAAGLLLCLVFALKAALAPLHLWLPRAYAAAGPAAAAIFAVMTKVGAYALVRVSTLIFGPGGELDGLVEPWLLSLGLVTIVVGSIGVLASRQLGLLVSHLVVVSAGTLLTAFGIGGAAAVSAGLYYLLHSTLVAAALFLLTDNVAAARGRCADRIAAGPLLPAANLLGGLFLVLAVAVVGLPPLSGFLGKVMVLQAGLSSPWMPWILAVVLVSSLLTLVAVTRAGSALFFKTDPDAGSATLPNMADLVPVMALGGLGILLVIYAGPVYAFVAATAAQLLDPAAYVGAVLGAAPDAVPVVAPDMAQGAVATPEVNLP
ncbi:monovalent cation/H+ antiporter subunit D [Thiohalocapsa marina]|uniref:Monovalent cation/H+ antiporter subunit D n=1 Tax=Thiohalocapsa marina TaxID=424902 RepID=A0A5M8FUM4_9GAMM|nr:monovalent cation/H+ antiporter subunit D [Thiohalocapsa marina]KAA6187473.1 monovalent cation/H+ antiporter subunit D [Thiohalocapsa marina]